MRHELPHRYFAWMVGSRQNSSLSLMMLDRNETHHRSEVVRPEVPRGELMILIPCKFLKLLMNNAISEGLEGNQQGSLWKVGLHSDHKFPHLYFTGVTEQWKKNRPKLYRMIQSNLNDLQEGQDS